MKRGVTKIEVIVVVAMIAMLAGIIQGCRTSNTPTADQKQAAETRTRLAEADRQIGMPDITNFTERRLARDILELRDTENLVTYAYIVNLNGDLIFLGEAIGFGLPYSVQFTNPETYVHGSVREYSHKLPQADPNGLFMPSGLSATWLLLKDPESGKARPVYIEPQIIVSPFRLHVAKVTGN